MVVVVVEVERSELTLKSYWVLGARPLTSHVMRVFGWSRLAGTRTVITTPLWWRTSEPLLSR